MWGIHWRPAAKSSHFTLLVICIYTNISQNTVTISPQKPDKKPDIPGLVNVPFGILKITWKSIWWRLYHNIPFFGRWCETFRTFTRPCKWDDCSYNHQPSYPDVSQKNIETRGFDGTKADELCEWVVGWRLLMWSEWIHHQKSSKIWVLPSSKHSYWNWWFSQMIYWLVVTGTCFMTFHILGMSSSQLTNSFIFQRGRYTTNQSTMSSVIVVPLTYSKGSITSGRFCFRRRDWVMLHWSNHQQVKFTIHWNIHTLC